MQASRAVITSHGTVRLLTELRLHIDETLPAYKAAEALRAEAYRVMQEMNVIHPGDPTYNEDQNIENYQKTCDSTQSSRRLTIT